MPNPTPPIDLFRRRRGGSGEWLVLAEPELHLGPRPEKLAPKLAGWRRERMPELPETAIITLTPDWACEVISESASQIDQKRRTYACEGVEHLWIVEPIRRTLTVHQRVGCWYSVNVFAGAFKLQVAPFSSRTRVRYMSERCVLPAIGNVSQRDVQGSGVNLHNDEWFDELGGLRQANRYPVPQKPVLTLIR